MPEESSINAEEVRETIYSAKFMSASDIDDVFNVLTNEAKAAAQLYPSLIQGFKYDEMNYNQISFDIKDVKLFFV